MGAWPIVGHEAALARLVDTPAGAVLVGPPGVGKTTLAGEAARVLAGDGMVVCWLRATREMAQVPLGVLAPVLDPARELGPSLDHVARARATLGAMAPPGELLLVVDDGHLLDELSAAVLHQCVAADRVRTIVTLRSGEPGPDAVVRLWKDALLERVELAPLTRSDLDSLLGERLQGPVDPALADEIWWRTHGNPLFVRELVGAGVDQGGIEQVDGVWRSTRALSPSAALTDLIRARLDGLGGPAREAFDLLVVAEPLDLDTLEQLAADPGVVELERSGLLTVEDGPGGPTVRLTHPLFGEVGETLMPVTRMRAIKRSLAAALGAAADLSDVDRGRVLRWQLDTGEHPPVDELVAAAEAAMRTADLGLAERCSRLAFEDEPSVRTGLLLGRVLFRQEDHAGARAVLEQVAPLARTDDEVVAVAQSRSQAMSYGQGLYDDARAALGSAGARVTDDGARDMLLCNQASLLLYTGQPIAAVETARPLLDRATGSTLAYARLISAVGHLLAGESLRCTELGDAVAAAPRDADRIDPLGESRIVTITGILARLELGDLVAAAEDARRAHERWMASSQTMYGHWLAYALGRADLLRGRATTAAAWFQHAQQVGAVFAPDVLARWAHGNRAYALVLGGRLDAAATLLEDADARGFGAPYPDDGTERATAWLRVAAGDLRGATAFLEESAVSQAALGLRAFEVTLRHDQVRLGVATPDVVSRLRELASLVDGPFVDLRAAHASALAARDAEGLLAVADGFERTGAVLYAAEAAAQGASVARAAGRERVADAAARRGRALAVACDAAPTPALAGLGPGATLTARERSIAAMAAEGNPSKEIATQLGISRRTVDNALQRVFDKLGVSSRRDLADVLD